MTITRFTRLLAAVTTVAWAIIALHFSSIGACLLGAISAGIAIVSKEVANEME